MIVRAIYLFPNGMVAALDQDGRQIPELQGRFTEVVAAILAAADASTTFKGWPDIRDDGHLGEWRYR